MHLCQRRGGALPVPQPADAGEMGDTSSARCRSNAGSTSFISRCTRGSAAAKQQVSATVVAIAIALGLVVNETAGSPTILGPHVSCDRGYVLGVLRNRRLEDPAALPVGLQLCTSLRKIGPIVRISCSGSVIGPRLETRRKIDYRSESRARGHQIVFRCPVIFAREPGSSIGT